jgi:hypothetical protein
MEACSWQCEHARPLLLLLLLDGHIWHSQQAAKRDLLSCRHGCDRHNTAHASRQAPKLLLLLHVLLPLHLLLQRWWVTPDIALRPRVLLHVWLLLLLLCHCMLWRLLRQRPHVPLLLLLAGRPRIALLLPMLRVQLLLGWGIPLRLHVVLLPWMVQVRLLLLPWNLLLQWWGAQLLRADTLRLNLLHCLGLVPLLLWWRRPLVVRLLVL